MSRALVTVTTSGGKLAQIAMPSEYLNNILDVLFDKYLSDEYDICPICGESYPNHSDQCHLFNFFGELAYYASGTGLESVTDRQPHEL